MIRSQMPPRLTWPSESQWQTAATEGHEPGPARRYLGVDLSGYSFLASVVLLRKKAGGVYFAQPYFWLPAEQVALRSTEATPFHQWADGGHLFITPGLVTDRALICAHVAQLCTELEPVSICIDRFGAEAKGQNFTNAKTPVEEFGGGFHFLDEPTRYLAKLIESGQLQHPHNPVFDWMYGNAALKHDPRNKARIDYPAEGMSVSGLTALVLAVGGSMVDESPEE